jgi:hypothetical protein
MDYKFRLKSLSAIRFPHRMHALRFKLDWMAGILRVTDGLGKGLAADARKPQNTEEKLKIEGCLKRTDHACPLTLSSGVWAVIVDSARLQQQ